MEGFTIPVRTSDEYFQNPTVIKRVPTKDFMVVDLKGKKITFGDFINNAVSSVGNSIYLYDHENNNCQKFVSDLLRANGLMTPELNKFINQDVKAILSTSPEFTFTIARFATETKAKLID